MELEILWDWLHKTGGPVALWDEPTVYADVKRLYAVARSGEYTLFVAHVEGVRDVPQHELDAFIKTACMVCEAARQTE